MKEWSVSRTVFSRIIGFLIFLIVLGIANYLLGYFSNQAYADIVHFFNSNIILLLFLTFLGMIAEIFWIFSFPFNIIAPIISAVYGVFILLFLFEFWKLINSYLNIGISLPIDTLSWALFWLVLIVGYIIVLARLAGRKYSKTKEDGEDEEEEDNEKREKNEKQDRKREKIDWDDVGDEFKYAFYNLGKSINRAFEKHEGKKVKKKK